MTIPLNTTVYSGWFLFHYYEMLQHQRMNFALTFILVQTAKVQVHIYNEEVKNIKTVPLIRRFLYARLRVFIAAQIIFYILKKSKIKFSISWLKYNVDVKLKLNKSQFCFRNNGILLSLELYQWNRYF